MDHAKSELACLGHLSEEQLGGVDSTEGLNGLIGDEDVIFPAQKNGALPCPPFMMRGRAESRQWISVRFLGKADGMPLLLLPARSRDREIFSSVASCPKACSGLCWIPIDPPPKPHFLAEICKKPAVGSGPLESCPTKRCRRPGMV